MNTQELIEALRADADTVDAIAYDGCWEIKETDRGSRLRAAASRLSEMEAEIKRLREIASNADRATRFVQLVASQRPSKQAREWYIGEFGDEGEPDFEGGYDALIQDARNILNDAARAALEHQQKGEKP